MHFIFLRENCGKKTFVSKLWKNHLLKKQLCFTVSTWCQLKYNLSLILNPPGIFSFFQLDQKQQKTSQSLEISAIFSKNLKILQIFPKTRNFCKFFQKLEILANFSTNLPFFYHEPNKYI